MVGLSQPKIINFLAQDANIAYAIDIPDNVAVFKVQARESVALKFAFDQRSVATGYWTIKAGTVEQIAPPCDAVLSLSKGRQLWVSAASDATTVELFFYN